MRVTDLRLEERPGGKRAVARVIWEQVDRRDDTLFFEVDGPWADLLQPQPEAFTLACLPFALWRGERRLLIEAALCPRLREGLRQLIQIWSCHQRLPASLEIQAAGGWRAPDRAAQECTAAFLSGGVDALSMLQTNRLDYPLNHPGSIRTCLFLFGTNALQMGPEGPDPERFRFYRFHQQRLQELAELEHFSLLPITTNVRRFSPSYACWTGIGFRTATVAAAHLFSSCFTRVLFASDGLPLMQDTEALEVPCCSSAALDVVIDQPGVSRQEKIRHLAGWPAGLARIQPCHLITVPTAGHLNCGRCEKCLRTKLGMLCLGLPIDSLSFADAAVEPLALLRLPLVSHAKVRLFQPLVPDLWQKGYRRLALILGLRLQLARLRLAVRPPRW